MKELHKKENPTCGFYGSNEGRMMPTFPIITTAFSQCSASPKSRGPFSTCFHHINCKMKAAGFGEEYSSSLCVYQQIGGNYCNHFNDMAPLLPRCSS